MTTGKAANQVNTILDLRGGSDASQSGIRDGAGRSPFFFHCRFTRQPRLNLVPKRKPGQCWRRPSQR